MSLGKKLEHHHVVERSRPGVIVHRVHPSVGRFKHQPQAQLVEGTRVKLCIKAAYAQSIAPVCGYGVFNTKVVVEKAARPGAALK